MPLINLVQITLEIWGGIFCLVSLVIATLGIKINNNRGKWMQAILFADAIQLFSDALAWIYRGNVSSVGYVMVRCSNLAVFVQNAVIAVCSIAYIDVLVSENEGKLHKLWYGIVGGLGMMYVLLLIITQFNGLLYYFDAHNYYHRSEYCWIMFAVGEAMIVSLLLCSLVYRKYIKRVDFWLIILIVLLPTLAIIIQNSFYGLSLSNLSLVVAILLLFIRYESDITDRVHKQAIDLEREKAEVMRKNVELADSRTKILISQIQPHFLFNSLTAIKGLIVRDPHSAETAVDHLAGFLRGSLDSLNCTGLIPIQQELATTKNYLAMEKYRFKDKLIIEWKEEDMDFQLPPFSIQPLVENAIHHGIRKNTGGKGTLSISITLQGSDHEICITDDGIGFDTAIFEKKPVGHYGISIVSERLKQMCNGTLTIESRPEEGTVCTIRIPKNG